MKDFKLFSFLILFSAGQLLMAQADDYSAGQLKSLAASALAFKDFKKAVYYYDLYLEKKPEDVRIQFQLAESYRELRDYKNALHWYQLVLKSDKNKNKLAAFHLANMHKSMGNCKEAINLFEAFKKDYRGEKEDRKYIRLAKNGILGCQHSDKSTDDNLVLERLNSSINGSHMEASPVFLSEDLLLFNSLKLEGENNFEVETDSLPRRKFYLAKKKATGGWDLNGKWENSPILEESQIVSGAINEENTRFYFSACNLSNSSKITCDIYMLNLKSKEVILLPNSVNSKYTETQVAVGKDYKDREVIYFVSDRKEGKGGLDLWYSTFDSKRNVFKQARNCGSKINTVGDEMTPSINKRNRKIYFSSDGHPGFGQLDVFSAAGERSKWSEPENIGSTINSGFDELYYAENEKGSEGVFASNRTDANAKKNSTCCDDLFAFTNKVNLIRECKGVAISKESNNDVLLENVNVKVYQVDMETKERFLVQTKLTNKDGAYIASLDPNQHYVMVAEKEGYFSSEKTLTTTNYKSISSYSQSFTLERITNQAIVIENIYYKFDKSELTDLATATIDTTIFPILINNPSIVVEISAHTDSKGSKGYNQKLSQERAESVVKYLRKKGISKDRLKAKGYGMSAPIAPNSNADGTDNPEGRAKNRRTEFKVIGKIEVFENED